MDDRVLDAFDFGKIQECVNIKLKLDEYGVSWEDFLSWIEDKKKLLHAGSPKEFLKRPCPECGKSWLLLGKVNHAPAYMLEGRIEGDYNCQWYCPSCAWEEFSVKQIKDEAAPYLEPMEIHLEGKGRTLDS